MPQRIGFISTRFAGTDGVSLESAKWAESLWEFRHVSFWYGGRLDRAPDMSLCVPEAHFEHPENIWINQRIWGRPFRSRRVTERILALARYLKNTLYAFVRHYDVDIVIVENALTIPMHVPLGIAITEFLAETNMPAVLHHHDFYWERARFSINAVPDYLEMAFPPRGPNIQHAVINQKAREDLSWRKGVPSILVPNVLDFEQPQQGIDEYNWDLRREIGLADDDIMILQPTRVISRKGIEHAIRLVERLDNPKYKLVISHSPGDEGMNYMNTLKEMAAESGVDLRLIYNRIGEIRQRDSEGRKIYTLWDVYPHAALVTYPSLYEGFGNAFLEAVYFKIPVFINRYDIYARDIEPVGFRVPTMEGIVTESVVAEVQKILEDNVYREEMVQYNYELGMRFFSYAFLRRKLNSFITNIIGM